jgi:acetyltransferase-like isoleucine patch superfamily enzyme
MRLIDKLKIKISILIQKFSRPVMFEKKSLNPKLRQVGVRISSTTFIDFPNNLSLAENVFIGQFNYIEASNLISIGKGTQITNYVSLTTHSSHDSIRLYGAKYKTSKNHKGYFKGEIIIGEYTFIGPYTLVLPNSKIGNGCIVKSHSVLSGEYPDYSIIEGNPAKVVGTTLDRDKKFLEKYPELNETYFLNEKE